MNSNAIGRDALEFMDTLLTPEEIVESNLRVALISKTRKRFKPKEIRGVKWSKAAYYSKNGKRTNKSSIRL